MSSFFRGLKRSLKQARGQKISKFEYAKDYVLGWLEDQWHNVTTRPIHRLYITYRYAKQGWKTHNFDYDFLLDDMRFKLRLMAECIHKNGHLENTREVIKQLLKFRVMLGNLSNIESFIGDKYAKKLDDKYGSLLELWENLKPGESISLERPKCKDNPEMKKQYDKDCREYMEQEYEEKIAYEKRVMQYFLDNFRSWWD